MQGSGDLNLIFGNKEIKGFGNDLIEGKIRSGDSLKKIMTQVNLGGAPSQLYSLQLLQNLERLIEVTDEKWMEPCALLKAHFPSPSWIVDLELMEALSKYLNTLQLFLL